MSSNDYDDLADEWLQYTEREDELKKNLRELKKAKESITEQLKDYMKNNGMDDYSTERGTIIFKKSVNKPSSCNKKAMKNGLDDIDWAKMNDSEQVTEHIFSKLPAKQNESLKRKKLRKTTKRKK
jgi:hypothetical protein